jgi:tRNA A37 methylthiotransferase MiaB
MPEHRTIYVLSNGCPESRIDLRRMQEYFERNGWTETGLLSEADLVLFNACAGTQDGEDSSMAIIAQMKAALGPRARLIVSGCLSKINPARLRTAYDGPTFGSDEVGRLNELFPSPIKAEDIQAHRLTERTPYVSLSKWVRGNLRKRGPLGPVIKILEVLYDRLNPRTQAFAPESYCIKVSTGCLGNCAYCGIRLARGKLASKPVEDVLKEFDQGLARGARDFSLIGTDLGCYGRDRGTDLVALLREMVKREGEYAIRLRNVKPNFLLEMLPGLEEVFATGRVSFLSSAVEAGSDRIVALMNRPYSVGDFARAIETIHRRFPRIVTRTQIVIGFPTETKAEFRETLDLVKRLRFDCVEAFMFQSRPMTAAAALEGQLSENVKRRRNIRLLLTLIRLSLGHPRRRLRRPAAATRRG